MNLTITSVTNHDKKKDGSAITDNKGRPKYRAVIKTLERGNDFLTGFVYSPLKEGQVINAKVETEEYMGKTQYRFSMIEDVAKGGDSARANSDTLAELKTQTALLRQILEAVQGNTKKEDDDADFLPEDYGEETIREEDLPIF